MYDFVLGVHSLLRWVVVILAVVAVGRALLGWFGRREWTVLDDRIGLFFTISMDVQVLLGLILYLFLSGITRSAFQDFGGAMSNPTLRYFAVEHVVLMIVALVLGHVGRALSKRAEEARKKYQQAAIFFGLAMLAALVAIPWWRPLLRLG